MPMVVDAMAEAGWGFGDLDRVAVTTGPGGFTGVRIGLAAARGIGLATGRPVVGVTTLAALAAAVEQSAQRALLVAIDSKRGDAYVQAFQGGASGWVPMAPPWVAKPDAVRHGLSAGQAGWTVVGDAAASVAGALRDQGIAAEQAPPEQPDAAVVAALAARRLPEPSAALPQPVYLRAPDVSAPTADAAAALLGQDRR